ncbi:MAG: type IV secretion system DNA-binding domain-containing protein [Candidatus Nealsonbacteria bacterium]|nr:type IV secretion system DNA-binding domain-containing protein [Candidatus Nealsonbacteria bacterium]
MTDQSEEHTIYFAETTFRQGKRKVGIKTDDRRRHIYVVGKTGMGKTALLKNMIIQDIRAGKGVGFIDPHGEAAEEILDFIPSNRINDVVYFNPADLENPIAFNVMEDVGPEYRHFVSSGLLQVFKKIWPDVWSARMEYILANSILGLLENPNTTLLGVNRMMADEKYREKIVESIEDPVVKSFWINEFARYSQRYAVEATAAIQNKIGQLISNPLIRNIIGQVRSKIDMRDLMDDGRILIANLSKGKIGEDNSQLLGALLVTKLQMAAMSRVEVPEEKRRDFFLYVDEFQNFATEAFASILSEARKYRLSLTLANQYIAQLAEMTPTGRTTRVRDAIFGNVGTLVTFRVGAEDAEFLEKEFIPELKAEDLVNLAKYHIYVKLMVEGVTGRPFSATTLPPFPQIEESHREKIIRISQERYGTEKEVIEDKIARWSGMIESKGKKEEKKEEKGGLHDAVCSMCGKKTKVPFEPDGVRPVYCKSCLSKIEEQKKSPTVSLEKVKKLEPVSFHPSSEGKEKKEPEPSESEESPEEEEEPKKETKKSPPSGGKKKVDLGDLKQTLLKALKKEE